MLCLKEDVKIKFQYKNIKKALQLWKTFEVVIGGLEPPTHGFSVRCSTN